MFNKEFRNHKDVKKWMKKPSVNLRSPIPPCKKDEKFKEDLTFKLVRIGVLSEHDIKEKNTYSHRPEDFNHLFDVLTEKSLEHNGQVASAKLEANLRRWYIEFLKRERKLDDLLDDLSITLWWCRFKRYILL